VLAEEVSSTSTCDASLFKKLTLVLSFLSLGQAAAAAFTNKARAASCDASPLTNRTIEFPASQLLAALAEEVTCCTPALQPAMPLRWERNKELHGTRPAETRARRADLCQEVIDTRSNQIRNKELQVLAHEELGEHLAQLVQ